MKKILYFLFTSIFLFSCSHEDFVYNEEALHLDEIAKVEIYDFQGNEATLITTDYLKEKWETQIKEEEGLSVVLEKFEILLSTTENGETTYFLKAKSKDGFIETGAFLTKDKSTSGLFNLSKNTYTLGSKTCTCKGCSSGCNLTTSGTSCFCSSCPPWGSQDCVKTEVIVIEDK